ncbi:alpha/beta hydrolase [Rhizobium calliandrae]|uniref:Alpha/beta hydrolase n=1 Tax=Rhizobium calliandrae TaxID=1312182 RepID=A0ABT7KDY2_9HYPH|nr:alpha/beta hydrolase [Rhizobium calliandrae]MDL2406828.1 alpha/beta hydrolase [Rhizobium calliandrae]
MDEQDLDAEKPGHHGLEVNRRALLLGSLAASGVAVLGTASSTEASSVKGIQYLETSHGRLAYQVDGTLKGHLPLLLLQRFRGTMDDWDPIFIAALARDRQVIRFDSAGVGRSEGTTPDSIPEMAKIVNEVVVALKLPKVDLLGWSMGGFISQEFTLLAPEKVRRLVITGSGPGGVPEGPQADPKVIAVSVKPFNTDDDFRVLFFTDTEAGVAAARANAARLHAQKNIGPLTTSAAFMAQGAAIQKWNVRGVRDRLANLKLPILVANGISDAMVPSYGTYVIAHEAPNAKGLLYPDAGHAFLFQYVQEFTNEVNKFLSV